ncbi:MAG: hypothetical protein KDC53_12520 [Saprospiraceae bacterium]|nr:hypothetical protein [Saprospiraceae bacterium]
MAISPNPLYKKLGMKPGALWKIIHAPDHYFTILGPVGEVKFSSNAVRDLDGIHVFTNRIVELEKYMLQLPSQIKKNGSIWFSWYKKSAKQPTEITEDIIRDTALALGLVDVKVCAVDQNWSALKIVWRLENR